MSLSDDEDEAVKRRAYREALAARTQTPSTPAAGAAAVPAAAVALLQQCETAALARPLRMPFAGGAVVQWSAVARLRSLVETAHAALLHQRAPTGAPLGTMYRFLASAAAHPPWPAAAAPAPAVGWQLKDRAVVEQWEHLLGLSFSVAYVLPPATVALLFEWPLYGSASDDVTADTDVAVAVLVRLQPRPPAAAAAAATAQPQRFYREQLYAAAADGTGPDADALAALTAAPAFYVTTAIVPAELVTQ